MSAPRFQCEIMLDGGRCLGESLPSYIVAELSGNYYGILHRAVALVYAAKAADADAVKLQTCTADALTINSDQPWFRVEEDNAWTGQADLFRVARRGHTGTRHCGPPAVVLPRTSRLPPERMAAAMGKNPA